MPTPCLTRLLPGASVPPRPDASSATDPRHSPAHPSKPAPAREVHSKVAQLLTHIAPAVDRARKMNPGADNDVVTSVAVRENVWQTIFNTLKTSSVCREKMASGELRIVGALCDISTGQVDFLGEHPWQSELITALSKPETAGTTSTANAPTDHGH